MNKKLKRVGLVALLIVVAGGVAVLVAHDQMTRHQRDLFSPRVFRRLAALGHMARARASVNTVNLLRDFMAWEPRKLLRDRASAIVVRMERDLAGIDPGLSEKTA
jgi:hypothetical protein